MSGESAQEPAAAADEPGPLDENAAAKLARERNEPVEASALTDSRRLVVALPQGGFSSELSLDPVRVQDGSGAWQPVDTSMVARADGTVGPVRAVTPMSFSGGGPGAGLARMSNLGRAFDLGWRGTLPAPELAGSTAVYRAVEPGVDLVIRATPLGFATYLVIRDAAAAKNPKLRAITFDVNAPGASLASDADGEIAVRDGQRQVFRGEQAMAWDSAGLPGSAKDTDPPNVGKGPGTAPGLTGPDAVDAEGRRTPGGSTMEEQAADAPLSARGNRPPRKINTEVTGQTVVLKPGSILTDSQTVFPLVLDPTWTANEEKVRLPAWTMVWSTGEKFYNNTTQDPRVGYDGWSSTTKKSRVYYRFDTLSLAGRKIDQVVLEHRLDHTVNQDCSLTTYGPNVQIYRTQEFSNSTTWSSQPAILGSVLGANNKAVGHDSYCPGTVVQEWELGGIRADLEAGIETLKLRMQSGDEANRNGWRVYNRSLQKPTLRVEYREYPYTPTSLAITHSNNWGAEGWYTRRVDPAVSVIANHPNGGHLEAKFQIVEGSTQVWTTQPSVPTAPRWFSRIVPPVLVHGHTYQLRAWSVDPDQTYGDLFSKAFVSLTFTVDTQAPAPPTITVPADANPPGTCIIGQSCQFSVEGVPQGNPATKADVSSYDCGLNTDAPLPCASTTAGALRTYSTSPRTFGPAWFTAHAIDKAGNRSAATVKTLKVESSRLSHAWALDGDGTDKGEHANVPANIYPMSIFGTWTAGPFATLDPNDRALEFNGSAGQYARTNNSAANTLTADGFDLRTDRDFSVAAWVRRDGNPGSAVWAVSSPAAAGAAPATGSVMALGYDANQWVFQVVTPDAVQGYVDPDNAKRVDADAEAAPTGATQPSPPGTRTTRVSAPATDTENEAGWVHLVAIFNDRTADEVQPGQPVPLPELTLWVNGRLVATQTVPETVFANHPAVVIGQAHDAAGAATGFWDGAVDDVRVFPGVLDRGQVLRIASERRP